jgi:hypothetical protein
MAVRHEWDCPPERRPKRRRPVIDITPSRTGWRASTPPRTPWHSTPLYTRLANLWIGAIWFTIKMVVAAVCGVVIAGSRWVIAQVASQVK